MRPFILTIAGFDPSSGAGLSADLKTFENLGVYGLAVCTANTIQSHTRFVSTNWIPHQTILNQLDLLLDSYRICAAKIGIIEDESILREVLERLSASNIGDIVWDPVIRPSAGGMFHPDSFATKVTNDILRKVAIITPNLEEARFFADGVSPLELAAQWSYHCSILCKSAVVSEDAVTDLLFEGGRAREINSVGIARGSKHGSGCVLSAAVAAALAFGASRREACERGKRYVEAYLNSADGLIGYHR